MLEEALLKKFSTYLLLPKIQCKLKTLGLYKGNLESVLFIVKINE